MMMLLFVAPWRLLLTQSAVAVVVGHVVGADECAGDDIEGASAEDWLAAAAAGVETWAR